MINKLIVLLSIVLTLTCCDNKSNKSTILEPEEKVQVETEVKESIIDETLLNTSQVNQNDNIKDLISAIERMAENMGFLKQSTYNLDQFKRNAFTESGFVKIFYETQFSKPKNKKISIIIYLYDGINSSVENFNIIKNSRYLDGIFKSGGFLIHHSNYLIQVASTCGMTKEEIENIQDKLNLTDPYLFCYCGGRCIEKI